MRYAYSPKRKQMSPLHYSELTPNYIRLYSNQTSSIGIGATVTVAQCEQIVENDTSNLVDPGTTLNNDGVGMADYNRGTDTLQYTSFVSSGNSWGNIYGADGMDFIMLHDIAHLTAYGNLQTQDNYNDFLADPRFKGMSYNNSTFWANNESMANSFAAGAAAALGMNISDVTNYITNVDNGNTNGVPNSSLYVAFAHIGGQN